MNFSDAMEKLKSGSKITRHEWKSLLYFMMQDDVIKSFQSRISTYVYCEDIMTSSGWLIDSDEKEYSFCDIIGPLQSGSNARLKEWKEAYIYFDHSVKEIVIHNMEYYPFVPAFDSFVKEDWIEL
jgi:hypothetical protein